MIWEMWKRFEFDWFNGFEVARVGCVYFLEVAHFNIEFILLVNEKGYVSLNQWFKLFDD